MGKGLDGAILTAMGVKTHEIEVLSTTPLSQRMTAVSFYSSTLLNVEGEAAGDWIRIWFPSEHRKGKSYQRAYTLLNVDPEKGMFDLHFVNHEPLGPASTWASRCRVGERLEAMRYSGKIFSLNSPEPPGVVLVGDLASYPAITDIIATIPEHIPVMARLVARDPFDYSIALPTGKNIDAAWIEPLPGKDSFTSHLESLNLAGWQVWIGAETSETQFIKSYMRKSNAVSKEQLYARGYWMKGGAMGKSRG